MKSIPIPLWDEMMDYWRCHKCALNDFILSLRQSRGIVSLTRPIIWSVELQEFLPAKAEWTEGVLCSECSSDLQLIKLTQQKAHPHFSSSQDLLWGLCRLTLTTQRSHSWLKIGKCRNSSNTNFCTLERFVKGKNPKCFVAVLKPHNNQIQPFYKFLRATKGTVFSLWPYQRIKPENSCSKNRQHKTNR